MKLMQMFCNHVYLKGVSCHSERVGNHNYVYDYEHYECEKCQKRYTVKILIQIDKNYYAKFTDGRECSKCIFEEDDINTEPCKSCIRDTR